MKKKIAFVTPIYTPAPLYGSDTVVKLLAEKFAQRGYDTSIITSNVLTPLSWYDPIFPKKVTPAYEVIHRVKVYRLACNPLFSSLCYVMARYLGNVLPRLWKEHLQLMYAGPALVGLENLFKKENFDVVHSSPFPLYLNKLVEDAVSQMKKRALIILTPFFHTKVSGFANTVVGQILAGADVVHTVSEVEKRDIVRLHNVDSARIGVAPLFLNLSELHEKEELLSDVRTFKDLHHLNGKIVILFAGNKGKMKGAVDVLHAVGRLYKKNNAYRLVAIGNSTPEWIEAKKSIDANCLIDIGYTAGKAKETIFTACDIFCMPSKSDSFGLVYLDAWHKKKPVIAADIPAVKELIHKNSGGTLVPYGNREALMAAIERLAANPVLSKKYGRNGYTAVKNIYRIDKLFNTYKKIFSA